MNIIYESLLFILWCTYRIYEALLFILWCTSHHHLFILWCTSHHYQVWCTSHQKQFWSTSLQGALLTHNSKLKISSMTTCAMIFFSQTSPASTCLSRQPYTTHASHTTRVALPPSFCNAYLKLHLLRNTTPLQHNVRHPWRQHPATTQGSEERLLSPDTLSPLGSEIPCWK